MMIIDWYIYCGIIRFGGGSVFVEFVSISHPRVIILHELIDKGFKVVQFPFVGIRESMKLRPQYILSNPPKLTPTNFNNSTIFPA